MFENKHNIKLICSDMDGTLLNTNKELPENFYEIVRELNKHGILFVCATGRQYFNVRHIFLPVIEDIIIVADNGGVTFQDNMLLGSIPIETDWHEYIKTMDKIPQVHSVLCCVDKAYIKSTNMEFLKDVVNYYRRFEVVPDFRYIDGEVIKVAAWDGQNAERNSYPYLEKYKDQVQVKVSSDEWIDINNLNCNKGVAIRNLQESLGISKDETMVFGDFLNDLEMMDQAKYSFAMRNAHPGLKAKAAYEAPSNNENGVVKTIEEFFNIDASELKNQASDNKSVA